MKFFLLLSVILANLFILNINTVQGQDSEMQNEYKDCIKKADSLYQLKDFNKSALMYSKAFLAFGGRWFPDDRYNAAHAWALSGNADSAFFNLTRITSGSYYADYHKVVSDKIFNSLHNDKRWHQLLELIKLNKKKGELDSGISLISQLHEIFLDDQQYRGMIDSIQSKFGIESKEEAELIKIINEKDHFNLIKVASIIDKYGWLGKDSIGEEGNSTMWLVIQHSNLETMEKYFPVLKEAAKAGKVSGPELAMLQDRILMFNGKKQMYGSQLEIDEITGKAELYPIEDEINVNKRRAEVGLEPLEEYVKNWNLDYKLPTK